MWHTGKYLYLQDKTTKIEAELNSCGSVDNLVQALPYPSANRPPIRALPKKAQPLLFYIGFFSFLLLLFVIHSRMAETLANLTRVNLRPAMILLLVSLVVPLLLGTFVSRIYNQMGVVLVLLTGWFLMCVPTSFHKGGSVNHLLSYWISTLLLSLCAMAYAEDSKTLRRMLYAIVAGTLVIVLARDGASAFSIGALGNPNLFGQHLLYTLPFILLVVFRHGLFSMRGILASTFGAMVVGKVVFAGSRSALIALCVVGAVTFFFLPFFRKLIFLALSIPLALVVIALVPQQALHRYSTIFNQEKHDRVLTEEELSAIESAAARRHHLEQSIELTFSYPLFGVGPGMFPVASAEASKKENERALWRETHNSFTQISSETGIPGLALYLLIIVLTGGSLWKTLQAGNRAKPGSETSELGLIAGALGCSLLSMIITGIFSSSAYLTYFPLLGCLAFGTARLSAASLTQQAQQAQGVPAKPLPRMSANPLNRPLPQARPAIRA